MTVPDDTTASLAEPRCSDLSALAAEPMAGTAPEAQIWIAVEHDPAWGDAPLARAAHGVRVVMVRGPDRRWETEAAPRTGGSRVWVAHVGDCDPLRVGLVGDPADVARWDLAGVAAGSLRTWGHPQQESILLVCANGRRDRCCGHAGRRLASALWRGPMRQRVLTSTHLGGHRFAPTALLLPTGALHGRLDERGASGLLVAADAGRTPITSLRGFSELSAPAQVAEAHVRTTTGYRGGAALPVRILPQDEPHRLLARVQLPGSGDDGCVVGLALTTVSTLLSCGRAQEDAPRWVVT